MSIKMMAHVWEVAPVSGSDLVVLLALADYGDDEGKNIYPSIPSIAKKARLSADQARRVIHKLIDEDKVLELVEAGGWDGKRNRSNEYRIILPDRPREDATPSRRRKGGTRVDASTPPRVDASTPPRVDASTPPRVDASTVPAPTRADPLLEPLLLTTNDPEDTVPAAQPTPAKPSDHPAVKAYREIVERFPSKAQMKMIAETDPPIGNWIRAVKTWIGRGHKPINIEGMLEWALNPALMERFSGNTTNKETIRNKREASNGEAEDNGGWDADELAAIKAARAAGDHELAGRIIREGNKRWKERMSHVQGRGLDDRRT